MVPELGGEDLDDVRGRHGRDLVKAGAELVGEDLGEQAGARGAELGQLDVGRSELSEGAAKFVGAGGAARFVSGPSRQADAVAGQDGAGPGRSAGDGGGVSRAQCGLKAGEMGQAT